MWLAYVNITEVDLFDSIYKYSCQQFKFYKCVDWGSFSYAKLS